MSRFHSFVRADVAQGRASANSALLRAMNQRKAVRTVEATDPYLIAEISEIDCENGGNLANFHRLAQTASEPVARLDASPPGWTLPEPLPVGWPA